MTPDMTKVCPDQKSFASLIVLRTGTPGIARLPLEQRLPEEENGA